MPDLSGQSFEEYNKSTAKTLIRYLSKKSIPMEITIKSSSQTQKDWDPLYRGDLYNY